MPDSIGRAGCVLLAIATAIVLSACATPEVGQPVPAPAAEPPVSVLMKTEASRRMERLARVPLEGDLALLLPRQRRMLALIIEAAATMDAIFWRQAFGDREALLLALRDPDERAFATLNYGPWDRFDNDRSFIAGVGRKPAGANFYPADMNRAEFLAADLPDKARPDTLLRRTPRGSLMTVSYAEAYRRELGQAARLLARAAELCDDPDLRRFLTLRARALITGDFSASDAFWAGLRNSAVDLIIGPMHRREDKLFGYKSAYSAWVLVRDRAWGHQLAGIEGMLSELQDKLPVAPLYRGQEPVVAADIAAYDAVYYAGLANAGPKAAIINVPLRGESPGWRSRKLYLKNVMASQFDALIAPVAEELIVADQRHHVTFDAFFTNTLVKEMSRGLGAQTTVNTGIPVAAALQEHHPMVDDGKAEILVPLVLEWLREAGELTAAARDDYYVTYVADTLRKVRAGGAVSDVIRFNYLRGFDGVTREPGSGTYRVHPDRVHAAATALATQLLVLQGNGDRDGARSLVADMGRVSDKLREDMKRLTTRSVPVGLVFDQGAETLGLP